MSAGCTSRAPAARHFEFAQYRGAAPAMQDLVGGHVDLMFDQPPNSLPHVRDGKHQGLRCHSQVAARLRAGHPDGGRGRIARILYFCLVRHVGAQGHVTGDHLQAQCGGCRRVGRSSRSTDDWPIWARRFRRVDQQTPAALAAFQSAKSRGGGRSSRRSTCNRNEGQYLWLPLTVTRLVGIVPRAVVAGAARELSRSLKLGRVGTAAAWSEAGYQAATAVLLPAKGIRCRAEDVPLSASLERFAGRKSRDGPTRHGFARPLTAPWS